MAYLGGREFLYANDADALLFRARLAAASFTICLALAVFVIAYSMWGPGPAFLSLTLLIFEPNIVAHGALVTTDMGVTFGLFVAVGCFYFYLKRPSILRLAGAGLASGVCLSAKHSGILIFPILLFLVVAELFFVRDGSSKALSTQVRKKAIHRVGSLAILCGIALAVLWSSYGFRYASRASGLTVNPPLSEFASRMGSPGNAVITQIAHWDLLLSLYLYGLVDVYSAGETPTYLFGTFYPRGQWFYFPAVFLVKSTLAFLLLLLLLPLSRALREIGFRREVIFLAVPPAIYFLVAVASGINFGVRHILPVYPFLIILVAFGAWSLARQHRAYAVLLGVLVVFHIASSVRAFPNDLSYANEVWGGPQNAHRILADSNVDWGQGLKAMKRYVDQHQIKECWFAYFGSVVADSAYYGIPCKALPASFASVIQMPMAVVPQVIDGPIFISSSEISGTLWGGDSANPYLQFRQKPPDALIADSILVFNGRFDISLAAALAHESVAVQFMRSQQLDRALGEAEMAVSIAPNSPGAHTTRGMVLSKMNRAPEAQEEFQKAQSLEQGQNPAP